MSEYPGGRQKECYQGYNKNNHLIIILYLYCRESKWAKKKTIFKRISKVITIKNWVVS